jgi:hypothetical protein
MKGCREELCIPQHSGHVVEDDFAGEPFTSFSLDAVLSSISKVSISILVIDSASRSICLRVPAFQ